MATGEIKHFTDTKEFHELRYEFEKTFKKHARLDREPKELNKSQVFYQHGEINELFKAYLHGYQLGRLNYMNQ